ncbi:Swt1 family HEPN domain-containing protein [Gelria sp. Kuro-4]|uniref:Swt1 family HEPN domain-containing protein n=1 Tax=Gelria sp. Kuro-4 TaxID=2796927 RepID=UPI001BEF1D8C|nr:Swt1 family HEPN domain-containing protein [Gelria sp. Kuro-4]BCV23911.1 hypothetical protein kuro4_06840 [Gelria sp. Kuro-4]
MADNYQLITKGFEILTEILAPYVCQQLETHFRTDWWRRGVLEVLSDNQRRNLPDLGDWGVLVDSLDSLRCLILIDLHWNDVFRVELSREHRNWVKELITTRNKWAHKGSGAVSDEDAWRALDTMARLVEKIDAESTEAIRALARQIRYGTVGPSTVVTNDKRSSDVPLDQRSTDVLPLSPRVGLPPWRLVVEPHPDVAQGRYQQAEFAADLAQVVRGTAQVEYQDPVEFFGRTYITEGMEGLLVQAVRRVTGCGGEPVIQLKTAFGGGKTHSMLALYHLLRGKVPVDKLPNVRAVLAKADVDEQPKAKVAVLVGTALNPSKVRRPPTFPGITIRTLWGEMAAQLAEQAGQQELYELVREADKASVPPGSETLTELLDACGPCVILIDELVAYARKLYGASEKLVAGTFDAVLSFVQELTEAARASKNSLIVASIPESNIEIGGEAGQAALAALEHTFGRMEAIWKPVGAEEGFEIVRRRLFLPVQDLSRQLEVCRAFSEMYRDGGPDFPIESKELSYFERLKACYPIHPEVFDRLYGDWATLERFQRTRGVLRLMAAVIHDLWVRQDSSLLIMPGSISLDNTTVREELTRYLREGWNAVVESNVDGPRSLPYQIDRQNPRFGRWMAARRVARAIFLGSAPSVREQRVRGIQDVRIRLGVIQPGEQVAVFNDALGHLGDKLTHLYSSNQRYWYDLQPNLRRTMEERAQQVTQDDIDLELETRLRRVRERADFAAVHTCPSCSLDVPDDQEARLVVLGPGYTHKPGDEKSPAIVAAEDILIHRGTSPRLYRNMLVFVSPDADGYASLVNESRKYLAWKSIVEDEDALNLDAHQRKQAKESMQRSDETVDLRIKEAYTWLLVPTQDGVGPITWEAVRIPGGGESWVSKAARKLRSNEQLITRWGPALLRMELDKWLWRDSDYIPIKRLWQYMAQYCYLPRLRDVQVLLNTIQEGLASTEFFAYAAGVTEAGRFLDLHLGNPAGSVSVHESGFLVKPEAAGRQFAADEEEQRQIEAEKPQVVYRASGENAAGQSQAGLPAGDNHDVFVPRLPEPEPAPKMLRRFYGTVNLDVNRVGRDAGRVAEEVIQHLASLLDAQVKITLEIQATVPDGVPEHVFRAVTENCRTLKFSQYGFEED